MSDVLRARLRDCLDDYRVDSGTLLDLDELAAELLDAVLPVPESEWDEWDEPIWWRLVHELDICTNCLVPEAFCACCYGCGGIDSDIFGSHGYGCAL